MLNPFTTYIAENDQGPLSTGTKIRFEVEEQGGGLVGGRWEASFGGRNHIPSAGGFGGTYVFDPARPCRDSVGLSGTVTDEQGTNELKDYLLVGMEAAGRVPASTTMPLGGGVSARKGL